MPTSVDFFTASSVRKMSDVCVDVLPLGKLRLVPGVQYRVIKHFADDTGTSHPVGEKWSFLGFETPRMYPGYVVHCVQSDGSKFAFRLRWGSGGQTDVVRFFETHVTGPVVPTSLLIGHLSPEGFAALARVRDSIEPLPPDSNALLALIQSRDVGANIVASKDGPLQPAIDYSRLGREFEAALRSFDV